MLVYHPSAIEITPKGAFNPASDALSILTDISKQHGIPHINIADEYTQSVKKGKWPFRDKYHPTALGQALIAKAMIRGIENSSDRATWQER